MRVTVKTVGESFDGEYIAESVCRRFDYSDGYTTSFTLKRNMCEVQIRLDCSDRAAVLCQN